MANIECRYCKYPQCGQYFETTKVNKVFCSYTCKNRYFVKHYRTHREVADIQKIVFCKSCDEEFIAYLNQKYCSQECKKKYYRDYYREYWRRKHRKK